jgi:hypothetical protein
MLELYDFREKSGEDEFEVRLTLRWREPDSNWRSRERRPASSLVFVHFPSDYFSWGKSVEAESGDLATLVVSRGTERRYGAGGEDGNFVAACNRWSARCPSRTT